MCGSLFRSLKLSWIDLFLLCDMLHLYPFDFLGFIDSTIKLVLPLTYSGFIKTIFYYVYSLVAFLLRTLATFLSSKGYWRLKICFWLYAFKLISMFLVCHLKEFNSSHYKFLGFFG